MKPTPELVEIVARAIKHCCPLNDARARHVARAAIEAIPAPDNSALVSSLRDWAKEGERTASSAFQMLAKSAREAADALEGKSNG